MRTGFIKWTSCHIGEDLKIEIEPWNEKESRFVIDFYRNNLLSCWIALCRSFQHWLHFPDFFIYSPLSMMSPVLASLHWLSVKYRFEYKVLLVVVHQYVSELLCSLSTSRSSDQLLLAATAIWNSSSFTIKCFPSVDTFEGPTCFWVSLSCFCSLF